jgi:hypothetical protein
MLLKSHNIKQMRVVILSSALILICSHLQGQNLIGYKGKDIVKYMKKNRSEMNYNNVVNSKFSYLKYSDSLENQTILFFLNADSVCRSVRVVCDKNMMSLKVKELNSQYVKNGENKWIDKHGEKSYIIELVEGNWSCIISIESEK